MWSAVADTYLEIPLTTSSVITLAFLLAILTAAAGAYYLFSFERSQRILGKRLETQAASSRLAESRRRSLLVQLGDRFDQTEQAKRIERQLIQADLGAKPSEFIMALVLFVIVVCLLGVILLGLHLFLSFVLAVVGAIAVSGFYPSSRRNNYINRLNAQLPEAGRLVSNSLQAGLSIQQAIERVAKELPSPAGYEFGIMAQELNLGSPVEYALESLTRRLPSDELEVMVTAILVQHRVGGNLAKALSAISHIMSERQKLSDEIETMTAEVRFTSKVLPLLPVGFLALMRVMSPEFIAPLFGHPIGWIVLTLFCAAQVLAFIMAGRIADIKV